MFDATGELVNYLRYVARLETQLDILKQELCLRSDYSALDHFRCIDVTGKGTIREGDLAVFLRSTDSTITTQNISAIFRRLDTDEDGIVSFSDFLDLIIPTDPHFESLINGRIPKNQRREYTFFEVRPSLT